MSNPLPSPDARHLVARLRFRHLRLLVELDRGGSLRAAATALSLTQPGLSKALAEVESAFGFSLFTRNSRGLTPTPQGVVAIRGAVFLLEELAHVSAEASTQPPVTVLRIGAPPFVAQGYLPAVLTRLTHGEQRVRVQLMEERVPLLVQSLLQGRLDALVSSYPAPTPDTSGAALRYERLFDADFTVIAPAGHALARARKVSWQRLAQERWIMPANSSMVRRMLEETFRRAGVMAPAPVIESTSPVTNVRLVAEGLGVSAVPAAVLASAGSGGGVKAVKVDPPIPANPVALIYRAEVESPRLQVLRAALNLG